MSCLEASRTRLLKSWARADRPRRYVVFVGGRKTFASGVGLPRDRVAHAGRDVLDAAHILESELRPGDAALPKRRSNQQRGRIGLAGAGRDVRCRTV